MTRFLKGVVWVTLHPQIKIHFLQRSHFVLPVRSAGVILQGSTVIATRLSGVYIETLQLSIMNCQICDSVKQKES